jgi:hypothetical protein
LVDKYQCCRGKRKAKIRKCNISIAEERERLKSGIVISVLQRKEKG